MAPSLKSKSLGLAEVKVKKSTMKGAGQGLFATSPVLTGTKLPHFYDGKRLTHKEFLKLKDFSYVMGLKGATPKSKVFAVDARLLVDGNPLRYVNGAKTAAQRRRINCKMQCMSDKVYYITTKPVRAGEEFVVDYGENYWNGMAYNSRLGELRAKQELVRKELKKATSAAKRAKLEEELEDALEEEAELREDGI
eukprot:TRINITY_DN19146_c0_g2_i1.p1 TRINITY_DN19146_c0_g2~~TRINITY_DN19146_c0_g2_i1.p1  ORF type:complete len:211 (-),score=65.82 TRINITY_DN19146_c0_g2_i1:182-763(-)